MPTGKQTGKKRKRRGPRYPQSQKPLIEPAMGWKEIVLSSWLDGGSQVSLKDVVRLVFITLHHPSWRFSDWFPIILLFHVCT